MKPNYKDSS